MAPVRKRTAGRRGGTSDSGYGNDGVDAAEEVRQLIGEMEQREYQQIDELLGLAHDLQQSIKHRFHIQLVKLPKQVREMPLKEFREKYGGNIASVLLGDVNTRLAESIAAAAPATGLRTRNGPVTAIAGTQARRRGGVKETPAAGRAENLQPSTLMRAPRMGEILYSHRGSPLGVLEQQGSQRGVLKTVLKAGNVAETPMLQSAQPSARSPVTTLRPGSKTGVADNIVITLKDGQQVTVNFDRGLEGVPAAQRQEVAAHLAALGKLTRSFSSLANRRR